MDKFAKLAIGQRFAIEAENKDKTKTTVNGRKLSGETFEEERTGLWFIVDDPATCEVLTF